MTEAFLTGVLVGLAVAMPLGAVGLLVVQTGAVNGTRAGAGAAAGVATADLVYAAVAAVGGTVVTAALRPHLGVLRMAGAVALLAVACHGLVATLRSSPRAPAPHAGGRTYAGFLGLTLLNPLTILTFAGTVIALPPTTLTTPSRRLAFVAAVGLASLVWQLGLACFGALVGARVPQAWQKGLRVTGNLAIAGLAVAAAAA